MVFGKFLLMVSENISLIGIMGQPNTLKAFATFWC
jgi:sugar diacid utilization regulator